jgi:hypothetical protein
MVTRGKKSQTQQAAQPSGTQPVPATTTRPTDEDDSQNRRRGSPEPTTAAASSKLGTGVVVAGALASIGAILATIALILPGALSPYFADKKDVEARLTRLEASDKSMAERTAALAASVEGLDRRLKLMESMVTKAGGDWVHDPKPLSELDKDDIARCCGYLENWNEDSPFAMDALRTASKMCRFRLAKDQPKTGIFLAVTRTLAVVDLNTPRECMTDPGVGPPDPGHVNKAF